MRKTNTTRKDVGVSAYAWDEHNPRSERSPETSALAPVTENLSGRGGGVIEIQGVIFGRIKRAKSTSFEWRKICAEFTLVLEVNADPRFDPTFIPRRATQPFTFPRGCWRHLIGLFCLLLSPCYLTSRFPPQLIISLTVELMYHCARTMMCTAYWTEWELSQWQ